MIDVNNLEGILLFVFTCTKEDANLIESSEGKLEWFPGENLPKSEIVDDVTDLIMRVRETIRIR